MDLNMETFTIATTAEVGIANTQQPQPTDGDRKLKFVTTDLAIFIRAATTAANFSITETFTHSDPVGFAVTAMTDDWRTLMIPKIVPTTRR